MWTARLEAGALILGLLLLVATWLLHNAYSGLTLWAGLLLILYSQRD
jgi:hypothetical protein